MTRTLDRSRLRSLALDAGIAVARVTTAEPFDELDEALLSRIRDGRLNGLDWFTEERAQFSINPRNLHPTARTIISVGLPYWQKPLNLPNDGILRGKISRYAWGRDYHKTLKQRMQALHRQLEAEIGRPIEARLLVDTARIVDRAVAARSGLGWYGKNTMILVPGHGSWVMLGDMIVDVEIEPDPPLKPKCGRCSMCINACPTGALVGNYTLDTPRCISYLTIELRGAIPLELRSQMGDWVYGCDVCQEVCPYTSAAKNSADPDFQPAALENAYPPLHWLLRMTESEFRDVYQGTAVLRTKRRGLARNAAVALGNKGSADDLNILEEALVSHDEPLVRGHAAWAMGRIDPSGVESALTRRLTKETNSDVRAEIISTLEAASYAIPH